MAKLKPYNFPPIPLKSKSS